MHKVFSWAAVAQEVEQVVNCELDPVMVLLVVECSATSWKAAAVCVAWQQPLELIKVCWKARNLHHAMALFHIKIVIFCQVV